SVVSCIRLNEARRVCLPSPLGSQTRPKRGENKGQCEAVNAFPYGFLSVSCEKIRPAGACGYCELCQPARNRGQLNWLPRPYLSYEGTEGSHRTPMFMVRFRLMWKESCA